VSGDGFWGETPMVWSFGSVMYTNDPKSHATRSRPAV
jgi:hypothetical protein